MLRKPRLFVDTREVFFVFWDSYDVPDTSPKKMSLSEYAHKVLGTSCAFGFCRPEDCYSMVVEISTVENLSKVESATFREILQDCTVGEKTLHILMRMLRMRGAIEPGVYVIRGLRGRTDDRTGESTMQTYTMNLAVSAGDERVVTGYQETIEATSSDEARAEYLHWLLQCGETEADVAGRILCDATV